MPKISTPSLPSRLSDRRIFEAPDMKRAGFAALLLFAVALLVQGCELRYSATDMRNNEGVPVCPPEEDAKAAQQPVSVDWVQDDCKRASRG